MVEIKKQIQELENESTREGDSWSKSVMYLKEFQKLSGVDKYIRNDAEAYWSIECYTDLLNEINELTNPELQLTDINAISEDGEWKFRFKINGNPSQIEMNDPKTDWIKFNFIGELNDCLSEHGIEKELKIVYPTSTYKRDQGFELVFIDEVIFKKLVNHMPKYAYKKNW